MTLAFNVADLLQAPAGTTRDVGLEEAPSDLGPELMLAAPIRGRARFHRTQRGVLAQCEAETTVILECSRCLQLFERGLRTEFTEQFRSSDLPGAEDDEAGQEAFSLDEHHVLDLTEPLRQFFTIELPLAPICRADCPGLCPDCGEPLGEAHTCAAGDSTASNPFAALRELYRSE